MKTSTGRAWILPFALVGLLTVTGCASGDSKESSVDPSKIDTSLQEMLPESVLDAGVLRVASDVPTPPFSFYADDGKTIVGVDPELAAAMGDLLGIDFQFEPVAYDTMLASLTSGKYDIAMTGMADTVERQEKVTFVDYLNTGGSFVVNSTSAAQPASLDELCGLTVGAQSATVIVDVLKGVVAPECPADAPLDLKEFIGQDDVVIALRSERVQVAVLPMASAGYLLSTTGDQFTVTGEVPTGLVGIAIPTATDPGVVDAVEGAMLKLQENGTLAKILTKYGLDKLAVERITVNGVTE